MTLSIDNGWTFRQYGLFRSLLGLYLAVHFVHLLPWAAELFSNAGMLPDASVSPMLAVFPNVFALCDAPWFVTAMLVVAGLASVAFACGFHDRLAAASIAYVLACLFGRNPLIANPALPYVGWMLLMHLFVPRRDSREAGGETLSRTSSLPGPLFGAAWVVLALAYSYSGYTKLLSPSWVSGEAIGYVLQNPLARDHVLRSVLLALPDGFLSVLTYAVMWIEVLFAPLALFRRARPVVWAAMFLVQLGFLVFLNFADLTVPMLLFHLLTFDPAWIGPERAARPETVFYDGRCGLCHRVVRFVLSEDRRGHFLLAPLQGEAFERALPQTVRRALPDSFVVVDAAGRVLLESDAAIHLARRLGGLWRIGGVVLSAVPKGLRDAAYRGVAASRHRWFDRPTALCPIVPQHQAERFVR